MKHTLYVFVQDHKNEKLPEAKVLLTGKGIEQVLNFDPITGYFRWDDYRPGTYTLQVSASSKFNTEAQKVTLYQGDKKLFITLGPENQPSFFLGEERVFYRPISNKILLEVKGATDDKSAKKILRAAKVDVGEMTEIQAVTNLGRKTQNGSHWYLAEVPSRAKQRESYLKNLDEVSKGLAEQNLTLKVALPLEMGENKYYGFTNEWVMRLDAHVSMDEVRELGKKLEFEILRPIKYLGNAYLIKQGGRPTYDHLEKMGSLIEDLPIKYIEPNLMVQVETHAFTPNDFLYPDQDFLTLIDADDAWDTADNVNVNLRFGSPDITVAVFDPHGVDPTHPDLTGTLTDSSNKMVASFDFTNFANQTFATLPGDHGTQCASSAVARSHNSSGATGIAGNCALIGARLGSTFVDIADGWIWAAGFTTGNTNPAFPAAVARPADVISNSWGFTTPTSSATIMETLDFLTVYGRNGRGCVICWSTGNFGYVQFTNRNRQSSYEKTLAIGASISPNPTNPCNSVQPDENGNTANLPAVVDTRAYFNPFGPEMDLVSPTHTCYDLNSSLLIDPVVAASRTGMGDLIGGVTQASSLSIAANAGNTTITVVSTAGFSNGDIIIIGIMAGTHEFNRISNIAGNVFTINALQNAYASGIQVATGPNDYAQNGSIGFGGTSHSCPTVAGAAALMLSLRPDLTWIQVREIIRASAVRIDVGQANAIGQWVDNDGDTVAEFSQWYGYGRLNINNALTTVVGLTNAADIVIRDNLSDNGSVPSTGWHANSPDIWTRTSNDPIPSLAYGSNSPHQNPIRGQDNYLYLRVRNNGNQVSNEAYLRAMICHFPGFEFRYPQEWIPSNPPGQPVPNPLVPGTYLIDEVRVDNLGIGANTIVKMTWPQNLIPPETVTVGGSTVNWHPCILAEVSPHDGPAPAGSTGYPVKHDNNLAHKNISIDNGTSGSSGFTMTGAIAGTSDKSGVQSIILDRSKVSADCKIFFRISDEKVMSRLLKVVKSGNTRVISPIKGDQRGKPSCDDDCWLTIVKPSKVVIACNDRKVVTEVGAHTKFKLGCSDDHELQEEVRLEIGYHEDQAVIYLAPSIQAIEIPMRIPSRKYVPVIIGMGCAENESLQKGRLLATQRRGDGEISAGYVISH